MELFAVIIFALMLATATARYAVWFECAAKHTLEFVGVTATIVAVAVAVGAGGAPPTVGLVSILGTMAALVGSVSEHGGGMRNKAPIAIVVALAQLPPHVTTNHATVVVVGAALGAAVFAARAWLRRSRSNCG